MCSYLCDSRYRCGGSGAGGQGHTWTGLHLYLDTTPLLPKAERAVSSLLTAARPPWLKRQCSRRVNTMSTGQSHTGNEEQALSSLYWESFSTQGLWPETCNCNNSDDCSDTVTSEDCSDTVTSEGCSDTVTSEDCSDIVTSVLLFATHRWVYYHPSSTPSITAGWFTPGVLEEAYSDNALLFI